MNNLKTRLKQNNQRQLLKRVKSSTEIVNGRFFYWFVTLAHPQQSVQISAIKNNNGRFENLKISNITGEYF